jgi:choline/glycine/proline betaine transport protein
MSQNNDVKSREELVASTGVFKGMHSEMSIASKGMIVAVVIFTVLNVDLANSVYGAIKDWITASLSWYYISVGSITLIFVFYLMFSRTSSP